IVSSFQYKPDNRTLLNDLLMSNDRKLKDQLDHTNARELKRSHERLCEFISLTETEKPFWAATDLVSRELVFTSELLKFAALKGLKAFSKVDWDLQEGKERLIGQYKSLWLSRNRPGGLNESAAYLEKA
ncbi:MAG: hypothetical protein MK240_07870, partial [Opitutales bacterium]|nr:hypothetical protein [Opitutales bacterium]